VLPPLVSSSFEDENLCSICACYPIDGCFLPCEHEACHRCLIRIIRSTNTCFSCRIKVEGWKKLNKASNQENVEGEENNVNTENGNIEKEEELHEFNGFGD
jgi:hypothetical protein